ncbi:MAG: methionyl-tRNA formyltransferase [Proteobacteria bacterium]|nr:MAG: methionyl-tRNA formyltransferase [Pseudomonadota bacterium]
MSTSNQLRVVFMGTPEFAVPTLKKVAEHFDIVAVYSQPDRPVGRGLEMKPTPVKQAALALGLNVFQPEKLSVSSEVEKLAAFEPDFIVVVAYGHILKQNVLDIPKVACVNVHSSLLPRWRGAAPIHHALLAGDQETGVTTMKMVLALDAGDVYLQAKTPIAEREILPELHDRLALMGADLIVPTLQGLASGELKGEPQDESLVTIAPKLTKDMEVIHGTETVREIDLRIRALQPWPGVSVFFELPNGKVERLKIKGATPRPDWKKKPAFLDESAGTLVIGLSDGCLELNRVQPEGKKEMDAASFLNGLKGRSLNLPLALKKS